MIGALLEMPKEPLAKKDEFAFGPRLRALRNRHGLTQQAVADRIGISVDGYRHWETGRSDGIKQRFSATASAFGLTVPELLAQLGFVPPEGSNTPLDEMTPAHWRQWLTREYDSDVVLCVTQVLEAASRYDKEDVSWIVEHVQRSLDAMKKSLDGLKNPPNRDQ